MAELTVHARPGSFVFTGSQSGACVDDSYTEELYYTCKYYCGCERKFINPPSSKSETLHASVLAQVSQAG